MLAALSFTLTRTTRTCSLAARPPPPRLDSGHHQVSGRDVNGHPLLMALREW